MAATPNFQREDMAAVAAAVAEAKRPLIPANYLDWIFFAPKIELAKKSRMERTLVRLWPLY